MNYLMSDAPYAPWLMDALKLIEEEGVEKLMVAGITAKSEVMTGYYHMEMSDKATVAAHVQADAVLDTPVAQQHCCHWSSVQSALRRASKAAWEINPDYVRKLAGYPLNGCPSAVQLLEMIYNAVVRG